MKNILIFIDTSLGELDWISPFVTSKYANNFKITIFSRKNILKQEVIKDYHLNKDNIVLLNSSDVFYKSDILLKRYFVSLLKRVKKYPVVYNFINSFKYSTLRTKKSLDNKYDFIFRDYNLKNPSELNTILSFNKHAKIIIYPHAVGIQKISESYKSVEADLWLENSSLSTRALSQYRDIFFVSGIPALDRIISLNQDYNDFSSGNILILTRNIYEPYGCTRKNALELFENILLFCKDNNLNIIVKHHPRDEKIHQYREIQKKFKNTVEYTQSLINIDLKLRACLTVFSSAGIFLTARGIPVFDFTPYEDCHNKTLVFHYCGSNNKYTHDLIDIGIQDKIPDLNILLDQNKLDQCSKKQFNALEKYFPLNANQNILQKLLKL